MRDKHHRPTTAVNTIGTTAKRRIEKVRAFKDSRPIAPSTRSASAVAKTHRLYESILSGFIRTTSTKPGNPSVQPMPAIARIAKKIVSRRSRQ